MCVVTVILLQKKIGKGGNNSGSVRRTLLGSCDLNDRRIYFTLNIKYKFVADLSSKSTAKGPGLPRRGRPLQMDGRNEKCEQVEHVNGKVCPGSFALGTP